MSLRSVAFTLILLAAIFMLPETDVVGQARQTGNLLRVPIFTSKKDSVRLDEIRKEIRRLATTTPSAAKKLDSLSHLYYETAQEVITGYRNVYKPSADHILLDSLLNLHDFTDVRRVSIYNYPFTELPEVLLKCKNLESLELINTQITRASDALNTLTKLKTLRIYNPSTRRKIKLKENHHVNSLVIRSDHPRQLPRSCRPFNALEALDLSENKLMRFPNCARRNQNLRKLILTNNKLTLKRRLRKHPHLEVLALEHNEISRVPRSIQRFRNLKKLSFNHNHITSVHPAIRHLQKLESLSFYHNSLPSIPPALYELQALVEIDLFHNQIDSVGPRIRHWKNLKTLYLSHNMISFLPVDIGQLSALEGLYLWDNLIEELPDELGALKALRFLWVNDNRLRQLPESLFHLDGIEELDLSHNDLSEINESVFDFKRIKILSLEGNPWNEKTLEYIYRRTEELRAKSVFVHVSEK